MAYNTAEARQELLDDVAEAIDDIAVALAALVGLAVGVGVGFLARNRLASQELKVAHEKAARIVIKIPKSRNATKIDPMWSRTAAAPTTRSSALWLWKTTASSCIEAIASRSWAFHASS